MIIGNNNSVSMHTTIYTASHFTASSTFEYYKKKTEIKDFCWLCVNSVILAGSELNEGTVIGANSVFKGISLKNGIYCGNPAQLVKKRNLQGTYDLDIYEFFT